MLLCNAVYGLCSFGKSPEENLMSRLQTSAGFERLPIPCAFAILPLDGGSIFQFSQTVDSDPLLRQSATS